MAMKFTLAAMALMTAAAPAFAEDLNFTLSNLTGVDLVEFYASPVGVDNWEENILGASALAAGTSGEVAISDGRDVCNYDLRMVFSDGDVLEDSGNLCETGAYTIN